MGLEALTRTSVKEVDTNDYTALHCASAQGQLELTKQLCHRGADVFWEAQSVKQS